MSEGKSSKGFWWGLGCGCGLPLLVVVALAGSCFGMLAWTGMQFDSNVDAVVEAWNAENPDALYDLSSSWVRESFAREDFAVFFASGRDRLGPITDVGFPSSVQRNANAARHTVRIRQGLEFESGSGRGDFGFSKEGDTFRLSILELTAPDGDQWGYRDPGHPEED